MDKQDKTDDEWASKIDNYKKYAMGKICMS